MQIPVLRSNDIGGKIGTNLGQGLTEGVQQHLQKKRQIEAAYDLGVNQGLEGESLSNFASTVGNYSIEDQPKILEQLNQMAFQQQLLARLQAGSQGGQLDRAPMMGYQLQEQLSQESAPVEDQWESPQDLQAMNKGPLGGFSANDRAALSIVNPAAGRALQAEEKLRQQRARDLRHEEIEERKETKQFREDVNREYRGYHELQARLNAMKELNKKPTAGPIKAKIAEYFDIPIAVLSNPNSELFEKFSNDLSRGVSEAYRGRILQSEFKTFMATLPTLMNSKEGRDKIIDTLQLIYEPRKLRYDAYRDIVKETGGKIPWDIEERVTDRIAPEMERVSKRLNDIISKTPSKGVKKSTKTIEMIGPEGEIYDIPADRANEAMKKGFKRK